MEMYSDTHSQSSPNKRFKTLTQSPDPPPFDFKGKSKVQERASSPNGKEHANETTDFCGICLSEAVIGGEGVSRGFIDSCNHYFCFVCIMEWAKVESKCPLCKRRFSTIRRPPKPPLFAFERVVHIPVRDQVYCNFGNATTGPPDPYSEVKCCVCHSIADDNLLLLCDLCDSGVHTYCIGLGSTVPEGDWFCQDCTLLRRENLESETNTDFCSQISFSADLKLISVDKNVSVSDTVREPYGDMVQSMKTAFSNETTMTNNIQSSSSRRLGIVAKQPAMSNVRTLRVCHNVHDRIRVLRENWDNLQSGKLSFSTDRGVNCNSSHVSVSSVKGKAPVSGLNRQLMAVCSSSNAKIGSGEDEVLKAWKMLERAKSTKQGHENSGVVRLAARCPNRKLNGPEESHGMHSRSLCTYSRDNVSKDVHSHYLPLEKDYSEKESLVSGKQKCGRPMSMAVTNFSKGSSTSEIPMHHELESSRGAGAPPYPSNDTIYGEKLPAGKSFNGADLIKSRGGPVVSGRGHVKDISSCKVKHPEKKNHLETAGSKQYYDAKSEIQALVKLNLKIQMKDGILEADAFKGVAWLATHSILAACGLEQPKPGYCSSPGSICLHPRELWQPQRSSLMPNSCSSCFYVFVKDVINASMLQKKSKQEN